MILKCMEIGYSFLPARMLSLGMAFVLMKRPLGRVNHLNPNDKIEILIYWPILFQ